MGTSVNTDMKVYPEQFWAGAFEVMQQNTSAFNAASANTLRLIAKRVKGHYGYESMVKLASDLVGRRDTASTDDATAKKMTQDEKISVKLNRKIGPVDSTLDAWRKIASDAQEMSFILGQQVAEEIMGDYLNTSLSAVAAALANQSDVYFDATGETTKTTTHGNLAKMLAKMGDKAARIRCFVMHSTAYFDLIGQAISDKITNVADAAIYQGSTGTMNRPVIVSDSSALYTTVSGATNTMTILGLTEGGILVEESEERTIITDDVTGKENLIKRVQGEYAFNLSLKGFKWDTSNGGANPTDAAVATGSNWDKMVTSKKDLAGVAMKVNVNA